MCGKFTQLVKWEDALPFAAALDVIPEDAPVRIATPMRIAKIMRLDEAGRRELVPMFWGFSKPSAVSRQPDHMHARGETVDSKPRFCDAFGERRGILMVETFNEGEQQPNGRTKQWTFRPKDRKPIAIAVIWEEWQSETGAVELTFIQVTVPANQLVSKITDRMPAILRQEDWAVWLGERDAKLSEVKALLRTFDDEGNWEMGEQNAAKPAKAPPPKAQMDLF
jgi:putative SOS response-associated peptidase YedK